MKGGMFGIIPMAVLSDKTLSDGDKIMYAIIAAHADSDRKCMQDEEYFAKFRGVEDRTIRSQITTLVKSGFIFRRKVEGGTELEIATDTMFNEGKKDIVVKTTESILNYWNSVLEVEIPYTTNVERLVRRRLQKFSPEQIIRAIQGRIAHVKSTPFFMKMEHAGIRSKIEKVLESDEALETFLSVQIDDLSLIEVRREPELRKFDNNGEISKEVLG